MKPLYFFLAGLLLCLKATAQESDSCLSLKAQIERTDFTKYIDKPVSRFVKDSLIKNYKKRIFFEEPPGRLQGCYFELCGDISVDVSVFGFMHMEQFSANGNWDFNRFLKEHIGQLSFYQGHECFKVVP